VTDESRPTAQDAPKALKAPSRPPSVGRRVGLAVYLAGLAYVIVVAFVSISQQVFAPPSAASVQAMAAVGCDDGASDLAHDLRAHARAHVEGTSRPADLAFFDAWDLRFHALAARCTEKKFTSLARLRHRIEITLRRFDREEGAAFARLARGSRAPSRAQP
jgi:hypothetical protein